MSDPKEIYLQPECCADPDVGRLWCEDDEPQKCEEGVPWTKYVVAWEYERLRAEVAALKFACETLKKGQPDPDAAVRDERDQLREVTWMLLNVLRGIGGWK